MTIQQAQNTLGSGWLAGRVVGILDDGFVLQDESGRLEITNYELRITNEGIASQGDFDKNEAKKNQSYKENRFTATDTFDVGDIVEVRVQGEKSYDKNGHEILFFKALELRVLVQCVADFFIRKEDPNYIRMIVDLNLKEKLRQRTIIFQKIREFFSKEDFLELDTPTLVRLPGMEPYLDVFKTRFFSEKNLSLSRSADFKKNLDDDHNFTVQSANEGGRGLEMGELDNKFNMSGDSLESERDNFDMYLITSPEYALKKLLASGFEKIFQLAKSFRNKETDSNTHNPEFTLLEWYRAYASYLEIMDDVEKLVRYLVEQLFGKTEIFYQGTHIDVGSPWIRMRVYEAFEKYADIRREDFENPEKFREIAQKKGYKISKKTSYDDVFFLIFMNEIEPKLGFDKPVILYDYPLSMAALSKSCEEDPNYAERFEVYIAGMELANAFTELNDPIEQRKRLEAERKERQKLGKDDYPVDENFLRALEYGMPPSGGIALGVDRLVMLLTDTLDIRDVLFFPLRDL